MNATIQAFGSLFLLSIAASCGTSPSGSSAASDDPLANCPVVGQYVQVGNDRVLSCDQQLLKDTVRIPLSYFAEDFELVKLDNRDEALVGQTAVATRLRRTSSSTAGPARLSAMSEQSDRGRASISSSMMHKLMKKKGASISLLGRLTSY